MMIGKMISRGKEWNYRINDRHNPPYAIRATFAREDIMIYALRKYDNIRIHIINSDKSESYICEFCSDKVIPRQGQKMPWHFSHVNNPDCIVGGRKSKGCIYRLPNNQDMRCKSSDVCERDCHFRY